MRRLSQGWRFLFAAAAVVSMAGCAVNTNFVYKPDPAAAGGPKLPAKVAVLPFKDGTEDFKDRGSVFSSGQFNLAKAGITGTITAITPELWGKSFADDLVASGAFPSARFVFGASEIADEEYLFEGTVKKAYWGKTFDDTNEFALALSAARKADRKVLLEKEYARAWKTPRNLYAGCGMGLQCMTDKLHGEMNKALQGIFAEARADLVGTIGSLSGSGAGGEGVRIVPSAPAAESADQAIERILKGQ